MASGAGAPIRPWTRRFSGEGKSKKAARNAAFCLFSNGPRRLEMHRLAPPFQLPHRVFRTRARRRFGDASMT